MGHLRSVIDPFNGGKVDTLGSVPTDQGLDALGWFRRIASVRLGDRFCRVSGRFASVWSVGGDSFRRIAIFSTVRSVPDRTGVIFRRGDLYSQDRERFFRRVDLSPYER